jgi:Domain of unknown function (DUF4402)
MKNNKLNHNQQLNIKDTTMKKLTLLIAILLVVGFSTNAFAQPNVSATATATGTIIAPIAISKTVDMNFGNIVAGAALGTVVLTPAGARSVTGGAFLPTSLPGSPAAASFTVTGATGFTYAIQLPAAATTVTSGGNTMTVDTWTSTPTVATGGSLAGGTQTITVGATLNVGANQAAGTYVSGTPFTVTVHYN